MRRRRRETRLSGNELQTSTGCFAPKPKPTPQVTTIGASVPTFESLQFTNHTECRCVRRTTAEPFDGSEPVNLELSSAPRPVWPANCTCVRHFDVMNATTSAADAEHRRIGNDPTAIDADVDAATAAASAVLDTMCWCGCRSGNLDCEERSSGRVRLRSQDIK